MNVERLRFARGRIKSKGVIAKTAHDDKVIQIYLNGISAPSEIEYEVKRVSDS